MTSDIVHERRLQPELEEQSGDASRKLWKNKTLSEKKLAKLKEDYEKRGVIYISRIPPHLKPQKLRHMLEKHGKVTRLYLAPEDPLVRKKRKKEGGNTGKNFTEGWVEFEEKVDAESVAAMLNGQPMGGKKRNVHYYDLWCIKYLPKFKWDNLTEEINYQRAVHEQKMQAEIAAAKRERDFYMSRVDRAKAVTAISDRKKRHRKQGEEEDLTGGAKVLRTFGQRKAKPDPVTDREAGVLSDDILQLVAGKSK